jgi:CRP-like cAMP-binding protein
MTVVQRETLKTGKRPVQQTIKTYQSGEILFEEDSRGREMFIIQEGKVGVYKKNAETQIELAVLDKGAMVGEMSLLDDMPRSATVRALEKTKALVINDVALQGILDQTPSWLNSIIKIVVSRLRDANKRVDQSILRDKERGVVSLIGLLLPRYKYVFSSMVALEVDLVTVEAYYVSRLKRKETVRVLEGLSKRTIIRIEEDQNHKQHLCIPDLEICALYEEYLSLKAQRRTFREVNIPENAISMLSNIAYIAQKSGQETDEGVRLSKAAIIQDLEGGNPERLEKDLLELRRKGLINIAPSGNDTSIVFRRDVLNRVKKIKEWLPRFEMELS